MTKTVKKKKTVTKKPKKRVNQNYAQIIPFLRHKFTPLEFESYCGSKLNLFTVDSGFDFDEVEATTDRIIKSLPSIKRIFAKPLIDLIDISNVMPVESVRKINSKTIEYSINHTQTIADIYEDGSVKPQKLLSTEYRLLYETYENRTFTYLVNMLLRYAKKNLLALNNYLFLSNNEINVNVLERLHHSDYYLAIGQLHTSYIRNFTKTLADVLRLTNKLRMVYDTISARLKSIVYVKCNKIKKKNKRYRLKKTNIFRNQKDYKNIYNLLRYLLLNYDRLLEEEFEKDNLADFEKPYYHFCLILLVFSLLHYNFIIQKTAVLNFNKLDQNFRFKRFRVNVKKCNIQKINYISLEMSKERKYRFIIYCGYNPEIINRDLEVLKELTHADEYLVFSPYPSFEDHVYVSINNIDSFRRLQQIILRGMVYSDTSHDICPFCGEPLTKTITPNSIEYSCNTCRTVIKEFTCNKTNQKYYSTSIQNYRNYIRGLKEDKKNEWLNLHNVESQMYFRNINKLNSMMEEYCPICGEIHGRRKGI